jgi:hypothetical protein
VWPGGLMVLLHNLLTLLAQEKKARVQPAARAANAAEAAAYKLDDLYCGCYAVSIRPEESRVLGCSNDRNHLHNVSEEVVG